MFIPHATTCGYHYRFHILLCYPLQADMHIERTDKCGGRLTPKQFLMDLLFLSIHIIWDCDADTVTVVRLPRWVYPVQIKICAGYWGTWCPRPMWVCQESDPRPRGLGLGVHDKPTKALGAISWYSGHIFICCKAHIGPIFNCSVGWVGNLPFQDTVPPVIVNCHQNEIAHQTIKSFCMSCMGYGAARWKHRLLCHIFGENDR